MEVQVLLFNGMVKTEDSWITPIHQKLQVHPS